VTVTYYNDVEMPSCSNLFQCMVMINISGGVYLKVQVVPSLQ